MTTPTETTFDLFTQAVVDDDDRGYPPRAAFVADDNPAVDEIVWRNLHDERRPTIVVTEDDVELLLIPCRRIRPLAWLDDVRGQMTVQVMWRHHHLANPYAVTTRVGRKPLAGMRSRPVVCA